MKRTPIIRLRPIRGVFDSDWDGVPNDMDCQWWNPHKQEAEDIKVYPNATIGEVRKNVKQVDIGVPFYEGQISKRYQKGNFMYLIDDRGDATALYIPSRKKKLKIMFEWKNKKWMPLTWREGER